MKSRRRTPSTPGEVSGHVKPDNLREGDAALDILHRRTAAINQIRAADHTIS